jgi:cation transport ATPase
MRKIFTNVNLFLLVVLFLASCSITKRRYSAGFHVEFPQMSVGSKKSFKPTSHQKNGSSILPVIKQDVPIQSVDSVLPVQIKLDSISNTQPIVFKNKSDKPVKTDIYNKKIAQKHQSKPTNTTLASAELKTKNRPISKNAVWGFLLTTILPLISAIAFILFVAALTLVIPMPFLNSFEAGFFLIGLVILTTITFGGIKLYHGYKETGKQGPKRGRIFIYLSIIPAIIYLITSIVFLRGLF